MSRYKLSFLNRKTLSLSLLIPLFFFFSLSGNIAQDVDCSCFSQLSFLAKKAAKTPAYQDQVKATKGAIKEHFSSFLTQSKNIKSDFDCFVLSNQLLITLNDNHSKTLGSQDAIDPKSAKDSIALAAFKGSMGFTTTKRLKIDLDSLEQVLSRKSLEETEGVYDRLPYAKIGVFYQPKSKRYQAVILSTTLPLWEPGELLYTLIPFGNNYFKMIGGSLSTKRLIALNERIQNGYFLSAEFQKDSSMANFSVSPFPLEKFLRKELGPELSYIKIGSFSSFYPTLSDAETFYASLENNLKKKHLIVDLRDNSGGGPRNSDILFEILQSYEGNIHVLINHRTVSNAEQFAHRIRQIGQVRIYGDRSNGTLAYEIKKGAFPLNCGNFIAILTSKRHKEYLPFESQGIEPDVFLDYSKSWIAQVKGLLE